MKYHGKIPWCFETGKWYTIHCHRKYMTKHDIPLFTMVNQGILYSCLHEARNAFTDLFFLSTALGDVHCRDVDK